MKSATKVAGRAYAAFAAGFVAYAVWGSLFPFDFHAVPLSTAAALFWTRWATDTGFWSLTDLVSNVLLFLPIGLLASAAIEKRARGARAASAAAVTLAGATALSVAIEFAQAFVSWRTPSIVDVVAEVAGAACGVAVWRLTRGEIDRLLSAAVGVVSRSTPVERILLGCCAAFAVAWLLPADFTLRPGEIGDKYLHKRLLLPWMPSPDAATNRELATIAVAAIPLGVAAAVCGCGAGRRRSVANGAMIAATGLVALELLQAPIFSRTTDSNELLAALAGSTVGAAGAFFFGRPSVAAVDWRVLRSFAVVLAWVAVVMAFEWWPFDLALDPYRMQFETDVWSRAPFRWPASAVHVIPGAALAAIAGVIAAPRLDPDFSRLQTMLLLGLAGVVFAVCEAGRVALTGGHPTMLSVVFKLSALVAGLSAGLSMAGSGLRSREAN